MDHNYLTPKLLEFLDSKTLSVFISLSKKNFYYFSLTENKPCSVSELQFYSKLYKFGYEFPPIEIQKDKEIFKLIYNEEEEEQIYGEGAEVCTCKSCTYDKLYNNSLNIYDIKYSYPLTNEQQLFLYFTMGWKMDVIDFLRFIDNNDIIDFIESENMRNFSNQEFLKLIIKKRPSLVLDFIKKNNVSYEIVKNILRINNKKTTEDILSFYNEKCPMDLFIRNVRSVTNDDIDWFIKMKCPIRRAIYKMKKKGLNDKVDYILEHTT